MCGMCEFVDMHSVRFIRICVIGHSHQEACLWERGGGGGGGGGGGRPREEEEEGRAHQVGGGGGAGQGRRKGGTMQVLKMHTCLVQC